MFSRVIASFVAAICAWPGTDMLLLGEPADARVEDGGGADAVCIALCPCLFGTDFGLPCTVCSCGDPEHTTQHKQWLNETHDDLKQLR